MPNFNLKKGKTEEMMSRSSSSMPFPEHLVFRGETNIKVPTKYKNSKSQEKTIPFWSIYDLKSGPLLRKEIVFPKWPATRRKPNAILPIAGRFQFIQLLLRPPAGFNRAPPPPPLLKDRHSAEPKIMVEPPGKKNEKIKNKKSEKGQMKTGDKKSKKKNVQKGKK